MEQKNPTKKQLLKPWVKESVYGISLLILGGIVGALIQNAMISGISSIDMFVLVMICAIVVILLYAQDHLDRDNSQFLDLKSILGNLENRIGLEVIYQETSTLNKLGNGAFDNVSKVMAGAEKEILILDLNETQLKRDDFYISEKLRVEYFEIVLRRVEEQSEKGIPIIYKRICQFNPPSNSFQDINDPVFIKHCLKMVNLAHGKNRRVYLKRTAVFYPMTFKIVDRKYLILHIAGINRKGEIIEPYLKGEIIIFDPQQKLIDVFLQAWEEVENATETVSVSAKDLSQKKQ